MPKAKKAAENMEAQKSCQYRKQREPPTTPNTRKKKFQKYFPVPLFHFCVFGVVGGLKLFLRRGSGAAAAA
jgi:hypothetical protein